jgi:nucleoid-associated protein YgaU
VVIAAGAMTLAAMLTARPHPSGPVASWPGDELAITTAWMLAVLSCIWLVVVSAVCDAGFRTPTSRVARRGARLAPAFVRRLVEVALVGTFVAGSVNPAGASGGHRAPPRPPRDEPVVRAPAPSVDAHPTPTPTTRPPVARAPVTAAPAARVSTPGRTYAVRPGDNLWRISRRELVGRGNAQPDDSTIARYWQAVIAANRTTLRSGNPNLIFPGELVALPEPG